MFASLLSAVLGPGIALATAPGDDNPRYQVHADVKPVARSDNGRYALSAEVRAVPQQSSADGRFALKSTTASCDPLDFSLFADGFET